MAPTTVLPHVPVGQLDRRRHGPSAGNSGLMVDMDAAPIRQTARTRIGADIVLTAFLYAGSLFAAGWIRNQLAWLVGWLPVLGAVVFVAWRHRRLQRT